MPKTSVQSAEPYSQLARIYDYVMRHVDYEHWARYIQQIFHHTGFSPARILDLACGTGTIMKFLLEAGYEVDGNDLSPAMVEEAKRKILARPPNPGGNFWCENMIRLKTDRDYDAVICLYDSFNYLLTGREALEALLNVYRLIQSPGLFIFDICTERNSVEFFDHYYEKDEWNGWKYSRKSYYKKKERLHINEFTLKRQNEVIREEHRQRIYRIDEVHSFINGAGFRLLGAWDGYTFQPASEKKSERVHFVLKKE